jgi:hypothetical protein
MSETNLIVRNLMRYETSELAAGLHEPRQIEVQTRLVCATTRSYSLVSLASHLCARRITLASRLETSFFISSSLPDPSTLHSKNIAFLKSLASTDLETEFTTHVRRLGGISERLQTEVTILRKELKEVKEIHAKRTGQASGKRLILKDKVVVSTEEVHKALEEAEKAIAAKKAKTGKGQKRKHVSESEEEASSLGNPNDFHDSGIEILDCIEVAGQFK